MSVDLVAVDCAEGSLDFVLEQLLLNLGEAIDHVACVDQWPLLHGIGLRTGDVNGDEWAVN